MRDKRMDDRRLRDRMRIALAVAGVTGVLVTGAVPALAKDGDVVAARGKCSGDSKTGIVLWQDHRAIKVAFTVKQGVIGDTWKVRILQNGHPIFRGHQTTLPPDGSFVVRTLARNTLGTDFFRAGARNPGTGEGCVARAAI